MTELLNNSSTPYAKIALNFRDLLEKFGPGWAPI